jgi:hypothetical protein
MASIINSTTTSPGGLISTGDSSNSLLIQTGDTTAITISSSQQVALTNPLPVSSGGTGSNTGVNAATSITGILPVANGGTGANSLSSAGIVTASANNTFTTYNSIDALLELCTITAAAPASTTNYDVITQAVQYYTSNAANNWTLNIRGNSGTTLNSIMAIGQSVTVALITTQGGTAYYATALQVDGSSVTPKYQGGTAWSSGNINGLDVYSYTIIKTANATFTALASQTQFK